MRKSPVDLIWQPLDETPDKQRAANWSLEQWREYALTLESYIVELLVDLDTVEEAYHEKAKKLSRKRKTLGKNKQKPPQKRRGPRFKDGRMTLQLRDELVEEVATKVLKGVREGGKRTVPAKTALKECLSLRGFRCEDGDQRFPSILDRVSARLAVLKHIDDLTIEDSTDTEHAKNNR